jgi:prolyl oligopeptidase
LLYGYGGFNISLTPGFSRAASSGWRWAASSRVANLRGGGEYGEAWHRPAAKLPEAERLRRLHRRRRVPVREAYTSPGRLAIAGGSNGGLLVGACMTQRPDLFGAALPAVGVMDMLRFQKFTAGRCTT